MKRKNNNYKTSTSVKGKSLWIFVVLAFFVLAGSYYSFNDGFSENFITGAFFGISDIGTQAENASCDTITEDTNITQDISSTGTCITIGAPNIILDCQGYTINYSSDGTLGYGISNTAGHDDVTIRNCNIVEGSATTDYKHGIHLSSSNSWIIENNTINTIGSNSYGIHFLSTVSNTVINHTTIVTSGASGHGFEIPSGMSINNAIYNSNITTSGTGRGIDWVDEDSDNNLVDNTVVETVGTNAYGIHIAYSDYNNVTNSNITTTGAAEAVYVSGNSEFNLFEGNRITSITDIALYIYGDSSNNNTLRNSYIRSDDGAAPALLITYGDDNQVINNVINQSDAAGHSAIWLSNADNTLIESNNLSTINTAVDEDAHAVLWISGSSLVNVSNNYMNNTAQAGFFVAGTTESDFNHNFSNNQNDGLPTEYFGPDDDVTSLSDTTVNALWIAQDNFVASNVVVTGSKGVVLAYADNVVINETSVVSSLQYMEGLYMIASSDNSIYNSNFSTSGSSTPALHFLTGSNSDRNSFYGCNFSTLDTSSYGIYIADDGSDDNLFDNSIVKTAGSTGYGIYLNNPDNTNITNSNITCLGLNSDCVNLAGTATNNLIDNCQISSIGDIGAYFYGDGVDNNILRNSYIHSDDASVPAVYIYSGDSNQIINNVINQSDAGGHSAIYLSSGADNNLIESNNMSNVNTIVDEDGHAVLWISGSSFTNVSNNHMNNTAQAGFFVSGSTEAHFNHNFSNNQNDGLPAEYFGPDDAVTSLSDTTVNALWIAQDNFVASDIVVTGSKGVVLAYADNVVINETSAVSSLQNIEGLDMIQSSDNSIYNSNFSTSGASTYALSYVIGSQSNRNSFYDCNFSTTSTSARAINLVDDGSDDNLFDNSVVKTIGSTSYGIYLSTPDNTNITNSNITALGSGSEAIYTTGTTTNTLIDNCQITSISDAAVYFYGADSDNNILRNSYVHSDVAGVAAVSIYNGDGNQIINNVINQSNAAGHNAIWLNTNVDDTLIQDNNLSTSSTTLDLDFHSVLLISSSVNANITNNYFENPNQTKIYINTNSFGIDVSNNIINATNVGMDSIYVATGAATQDNNFTNNTIVGPKINLDGMQTNWWNNTFLAEDGTTSIMYSSLQINGSDTFQLDEVNFLVANNTSAVNSSHLALNESFDTSANVSFYNINCSGFSIYYDAQFIDNQTALTSGTAVATQADIDGNCDGNVCTDIACANSIVTMAVPSWSSFAIVEGAADSAPDCGTITENTTLTQNVTATTTCFFIGADDVTLNCAGYLINYSTNGTEGYGVTVIDGYHNATVKNCIVVEGNASGDQEKNAINFIGTNNGVVENNIVTTIGIKSYGMHFHQSNNTNFTNNTVVIKGVNSTAFQIENSISVLIIDNIANATGTGSFGMAFYLTNNSNATNNIFEVNGEELSGVVIVNGTNNKISDNNITANGTSRGISLNALAINTLVTNNIVIGTNSGDGMLVQDSANFNNITDNTITTGGSMGIGIETDSEVLNLIIKNNTIITNGATALGMNLGTLNQSEIINNVLISNGTLAVGFYIPSASYNNFTGNTITTYGDTSDAIMLLGPSKNNIFDNNTIITNDNNASGISDAAGSNNITNNIINTTGDFSYGLYITDADNDSIIDNQVDTNGSDAYGVYLKISASSTTNNVILNNNITSTNAEEILDDTGASGVNYLIYNNSLGQINWSKTNLTTDVLLDIGTNVFIQNNLVGLTDSSNTLSLNGSTVIEIRGLGYASTPFLNKDGFRCDNSDACNISYDVSEGVLTANVSSFSNYTTSAFNNAPVIDTLVLNSTLGTNLTSENLTVYFNTTDADNEDAKNITNWKLNGTSIAVLNMPFEKVTDLVFNATKDYSDFSNNGSEQGGVTWNATGGYDGKGAYEFDGVDDRITIGDDSSLHINTSMTLAFWIYPKNLGEHRENPLDKSYGGEFALTLEDAPNTGRLSFYHGTQRSTDLYWGWAAFVDGTIVDNEWQFIVITRDSSDRAMKSYYNGQLNGSTTYSSDVNKTPSTSSYDVVIGDGYSYNFNGTMDNVLIFNRTLSADQINALYNNRTYLISSEETSKGDNWTACITPNDGTIDGSESCSGELIILNTVPVFDQSLTAQSADSGVAFTYDVNCSDVDSDTITYYDNTSFFNIDSSTGVISDTPDQSEAGTYNINITCSDGTANTSETFAYTISDVTVPIFSNANNTSVAFKRYQNFTANITIDNTNLAYYVFSTNASGTWSNVTRDISGVQYNASEDGNISLAQGEQICWYYWANDSASNDATSTTYCFNVVNSAPTFNESLTAQSANSGVAFTYDVNCSDVDSDTVTYYDNTSLFNIDSSTGVISDTPDQSEAGTYNINITCGDGTANTSETFAYTINDATVPTFSNANNTSVAFKRYQNFTANITIDNTNLAYYVFSTNASGTWSNVTRDISGVQYNASEDDNISLAQGEQICWYYWANDSASNDAKSTTYCFNVVNTIPTTSSVNITSSDNLNRTNGTLTGTYTFSDVDDDSESSIETQWYNDSILVSALNDLTSVASSNTTKGENWTFSVRVYDSTDWSGWVNSSILNITNTAPTFNPDLITQSVTENVAITYQINCSDIDGDVITYYDNTSLFNINSSSGLITDTPSNSEIGSYNINITCSDGATNTSQTFVYTVNEVATEPPSTSEGGGGTSRECTQDANCPEGKYCRDYICHDYQCTEKSDCAAEEYCVDYQCVKLFDLRILQFDSPIEPGEFLDFNYLMKLMADASGDVNLEFWLENEEEKVASRSEVIFMNAFEEKIEKGQLFLPSDISPGRYTLWAKLNFEGYEITSHVTIEVKLDVPLTLSIAPLELPEIIPNVPWSYSAVLIVNKDPLIPTVIKRNITKKGKLIWLAESETVINRSVVITDNVPGLKNGDYLLEWSASTGNLITHSKKMFRVGEPGISSWWWISLLLLLVIVSTILVIIYWRKRGPKRKAAQLENFIVKSIKQGTTEQEIKEMLINRGWPKHIIEDYLKKISERIT